MKELLTAIKPQLQDDLDYIRNGDIYITPHENYIPAHIKFPCVGIKDGPITRRELSGGEWEITLIVKFVIYVQIYKIEASIMGDDGGQKGVLEIEEDIQASLDENLLGIEGMQQAFSPGTAESRFFGDDKENLQQYIVTYQYIKQETRASGVE